MKALSIRQPWAWAILHAGKRIENRDWKGYGGNSGRDKGFRGEFLIHASKRPNPTATKREALDFRDFCRERRIQLPDGETPGKLTINDLFRNCGGIVGVARVVDIRPNGDNPLDPWAIPGLLGIVLEDVRPLPLIACPGALGWWPVPTAVIAEVEKARAS